jgi:hypothetical protein
MIVFPFWLFYYCTNEKFGGHAEVKADIVPMLKFVSFKVGSYYTIVFVLK